MTIFKMNLHIFKWIYFCKRKKIIFDHIGVVKMIEMMMSNRSLTSFLMLKVIKHVNLIFFKNDFINLWISWKGLKGKLVFNSWTEIHNFLNSFWRWLKIFLYFGVEFLSKEFSDIWNFSFIAASCCSWGRISQLLW